MRSEEVRSRSPGCAIPFCSEENPCATCRVESTERELRAEVEALRAENEDLRVELDAAVTDLRSIIGRVRRFEVTLEDARKVVLYGRDREDALSRLPSSLPKPPAYVEWVQRAPVVRVDEVGGERDDGTMDYGPPPGPVTDNRRTS